MFEGQETDVSWTAPAYGNRGSLDKRSTMTHILDIIRSYILPSLDDMLLPHANDFAHSFEHKSEWLNGGGGRYSDGSGVVVMA